MEFYIHKNNQQLGPFDESQIAEKIKIGELSLDDTASFATLYSEILRLGDIFHKPLLEGLRQLDGWLKPPATLYRPTKVSQIRGFNLLLPIANDGNRFAQFRIGKCYFEGVGVAQSQKDGQYWLEKAGLEGSAEAQFYLGEFYLKQYVDYIDRSVETINLAFKWMKMAADQDYLWAILNDHWKSCTLAYQNECVEEFTDTLKQAEAGDPSAQQKTSLYYDIGFGTKKCSDKAAYWLAEFDKNKSSYIESLKILIKKGDANAELELSSLTEPSLLGNPEACLAEIDSNLEKLKKENPKEYKKMLRKSGKIPEFGPLPIYIDIPD
jgi:hypothetical protein